LQLYQEVNHLGVSHLFVGTIQSGIYFQKPHLLQTYRFDILDFKLIVSTPEYRIQIVFDCPMDESTILKDRVSQNNFGIGSKADYMMAYDKQLKDFTTMYDEEAIL
jgi:hypothetical protein